MKTLSEAIELVLSSANQMSLLLETNVVKDSEPHVKDSEPLLAEEAPVDLEAEPGTFKDMYHSNGTF